MSTQTASSLHLLRLNLCRHLTSPHSCCVPLPFLSFQIRSTPFPQPAWIGVPPSEWETKFRIQIFCVWMQQDGSFKAVWAVQPWRPNVAVSAEEVKTAGRTSGICNDCSYRVLTQITVSDYEWGLLHVKTFRHLQLILQAVRLFAATLWTETYSET